MAELQVLVHICPAGSRPIHVVSHGMDCWCEPLLIEEGKDSDGNLYRVIEHGKTFLPPSEFEVNGVAAVPESSGYDVLMQDKLEAGEAVDLSGMERTSEGDYMLNFEPSVDLDYCDYSIQQWVWSIGRHKKSGLICASLSTKYYKNPEYQMIWLR